MMCNTLDDDTKNIILPHHPKFVTTEMEGIYPLNNLSVESPTSAIKHVHIDIREKKKKTLLSQATANGGAAHFSFETNRVVEGIEEDVLNRKRSKGVVVWRKIVSSSKWTFTGEDLQHVHQIQMVDDLLNGCLNQQLQIIQSHIKMKIGSYKIQDIKKSMYEESQFITYEYILNKLKENMKCCYCHNPVYVLYERVRDPRQWTVERIDNYYGHNIGNVGIACLGCNLRRNTMYIQRFVDTKNICQGNVVKLKNQESDHLPSQATAN
jgi:hypothetical protein